MDMEYNELGRTGLKVSVAGFGCGGNSRLGLGHGKTFSECVGIAREAISFGVNFFDTAEAYGTEDIVGQAISGYPRDQYVISTKVRISREGRRLRPVEIVRSLEASLRRLGTDYVDIFHLHGVPPQDYDYALETFASALLEQKRLGKIRCLGITETASRDSAHEMLTRAVGDEIWDVVMLAYHMLNQNARSTVFPAATSSGIGTLLMFVVRNIFSQAGYLQDAVRRLVNGGDLSADQVDLAAPLEFLIHEGGASSLVDAAYRFARHEPGADVILFGTGNSAHVKSNIASILAPPLPTRDMAKLYQLFGGLRGVGLDAPDHMTKPV